MTVDPPEPIPPAVDDNRFQSTSTRIVAGLLFLATCVSTFFVGILPGVGLPSLEGLRELPADEFQAAIRSGITYMLAVVGILLAHELGHYFQAKRYGIPVTWPFFLPMPLVPFGTLGAVLFHEMPGDSDGNTNGNTTGSQLDRRVLYDIAISGPLAGLLVALPLAWIGISRSIVYDLPSTYFGPAYGDPLIFDWMITAKHGALLPGQVIEPNALAFAGWFGIFHAALNLLPVGQLDGGRILYTLAGRAAHYISYAILLGGIGYIVYSRNYAFSLLIVLLFFLSPKHPPTDDDTAPLGIGRQLLGWVTLAFVVIGLTLQPLQWFAGS